MIEKVLEAIMSSSSDQSLQGQELPHIANVHPNISNSSHVQICLFFSFNPAQRLAYSPDAPVGDAAKLYWHFYRADQSGAAGVIITLFLYAVLFLLSITILSIYILR